MNSSYLIRLNHLKSLVYLNQNNFIHNHNKNIQRKKKLQQIKLKQIKQKQLKKQKELEKKGLENNLNIHHEFISNTPNINNVLIENIKNNLNHINQTENNNPLNLIQKTNKPLNHFDFIHIGKCGGTTLLKEFKKNKISFRHIHINKFQYNPKSSYLIVIRNPIKRFVSAFYWRYYKVVDSKEQEFSFKGEKGLLLKYKTINNYAENIYNEEGKLNNDFILPRKYIRHIVEDIHFYLGDFLNKVNPKNIKAVLLTENLKNDVYKYFHFECSSNENDMNSKNYDKFLSEKAYNNLKKFLAKDYKCIDKLYKLKLINDDQYKILSK